MVFNLSSEITDLIEVNDTFLMQLFGFMFYLIIMTAFWIINIFKVLNEILLFSIKIMISKQIYNGTHWILSVCLRLPSSNHVPVSNRDHQEIHINCEVPIFNHLFKTHKIMRCRVQRLSKLRTQFWEPLL